MLFLCLLLIPSSERMIAKIIFDKVMIAYGQSSQTIFNATNPLNLQDIPAKKVHVGDIDIAYKMLGKGNPIILIGGVPLVMDAWPSSILQELSSNHTVIIFDNRQHPVLDHSQ